VTAGLLAAIGACGSYGTASVLQAVAAQRQIGQPLDLRTLTAIVGRLVFVVGVGLDLAGFALNVVALQSLPLFLVQSLVAASVAVTAVLAVAMLRLAVHPRALLGLACVLVGLVLLAAAAKPGPAHALSHAAQWTLVGMLPIVGVATVAAARRGGRLSSPLLSGGAGCSFAAVAIAARSLTLRSLWWHVGLSPCALAIVGFGVVGLAAFTAALARGSVIAATAVMSAMETVIPTVVGLTVLGDKTRSGGVALVLTAVSVTLVGVIALAPYADMSLPS
jgi:drug/metabolite transporter (DMT)-like permease